MIPIANVQAFSLSDFPGTPAAIIFTQGCNFNCAYCYNKELIPITSFCKDNMQVWDETFQFLRRRSGALAGVVFTGGEPLLHGMNLAYVLDEVKHLGFKVKVDTNGAFPEMLGWIVGEELVDYVALTVKAPWEKYGSITQLQKYSVDKVRASLELLKNSSVPFEVRTVKYKNIIVDEDVEIIKAYLPPKVAHIVTNAILI